MRERQQQLIFGDPAATYQRLYSLRRLVLADSGRPCAPKEGQTLFQAWVSQEVFYVAPLAALFFAGSKS